MPTLVDRIANASGSVEEEEPGRRRPTLDDVIALAEVPEPELFTWALYELVLARRPDAGGFRSYADRATTVEERRRILWEVLASDEARGRARLPDAERRAARLLLSGHDADDASIEVLLAIGELERQLRKSRHRDG